MLKSGGKVSLLLKLRRWICVCVRKRLLDAGVRARVRPVILGGFACWCDKSD